MEGFKLDPTKYASLGALINDGPPNCELLAASIYYSDPTNTPVPLEKVAVAITAINKGDYIYTDYYFGHAVKQSPYSINEDALINFSQQFEHSLDFTKLGRMGPVSNSFSNSKVDAEKLNLIKLQYILATPCANALLHTKFAFDPVNTLANLESLKANFNNVNIWKHFLQAKILLSAIIKINIEDRDTFAALAQEISQQSLNILCDFIIKQNWPLYIEHLVNFGRALDKLKLLTQGTLLGSYWNSTEVDDFKNKYFGDEHQKELQNEDFLMEFPKEYHDFYRYYRKEFIEVIAKKLINN